MKISIVIPVYNVEQYILNCLRSVVNQRHINHLEIECVLIDDCGKDQSIGKAENYIREYKGPVEFKLIKHTQNRGLSAARNTGINSSTGDYILFLDSDDTLPQDSIYNLSLPLNVYPYDFVLGGVKTSGVITKAPSLCLSEGAYVGSDVVRETYLDHKWYMMAWNKLCNLKFLRSHNLYFEEGLIHEDDLWSFLLSLHARSFYAVQQDTYNYVVRSGSITTNRNLSIHIDAYLFIVNKITSYIQSYNLGSKAILFCHQYILGIYIYLKHLAFIKGFFYFREIINSRFYLLYYEEILLLESHKHLFKIRLMHVPTIIGYCILRTAFLLASVKGRLTAILHRS